LGKKFGKTANWTFGKNIEGGLKKRREGGIEGPSEVTKKN